MQILSGLEPNDVFFYFEEICTIPHGSYHTKQISDYLVNFAKSQNLRYIQDETENVIIFKSGSKGYEQSAPIILQGHMDMVCEKESDCDIDFLNEGLRLELQNGIISAKGTTLGGDDGIAVAYMLAILASDTIPHPPLEAIFTTNEEVGLLGAAALDCSPLKSRTMINLDSEDEGVFCVSCAGGATATAHLPCLRTENLGIPATLNITGLIGGHSGTEIDKGRANAAMLLGRTLYQISVLLSGRFDLVSVHGGKKDNAIPREAAADLLFQNAEDLDAAVTLLNELEHIYRKEYHATDADITLSLSVTSDASQSSVLQNESAKKVITALVTLPNGIQKMSHDIKGLVQTSLNLGILETKEHEILFSFSVRSNILTEKLELTDRIRCLIDALGGTVTLSGDYPAWEYKEHSKLKDIMVSVFKKQYGRMPLIQAIHAGVECGLFAEKLNGLDCVSIGPDIIDIHTPKEHLEVMSVKRTWEFLLEILKELR